MNTIHRAHKIRLAPTAEQRDYFTRACGTARFAYNWGLAEWQRMYETGEKPTWYKVKKNFNAIKHEEYPWVAEVTKWATQGAAEQLGKAYENFFSPTHKGRRPVFKKKGKCRDSFVIAIGDEIKLDGKRLWVPKLGWVKMRQELRFEGRPLRVTISRTADHWYAAISVEIPWEVPVRESQADGGLDVGIEPLAVESDGTRWENPRALIKEEKKLRRWQRKLARRTPGSSGYKKAQMKVARIHERIANVRNDAHHKLSRSVVDKYSRLGIESLNVSGMLKNKRLSKHLSDAALSGLLTKVQYKAEQYGTEIVEAGRWFPSSKTCSVCGLVNDQLGMRKSWTCECGAQHDRDLNAALNLKHLVGRGASEFTPMDSKALAA